MNSNIFTVDVEEYYQAENIALSLPAEKINILEDRIEIGVRKLLGLLESSKNKATFFVLACLAQKNKNLIREISMSGHEIASHGYEHTPLYKHTPETFENDLGKSLKILSDITGQKILGYRATSFSLCEDIPWFGNILKKHGLIYDSSSSYSLFRKHWVARPLSQNYFELCEGLKEFSVSSFSLGPVKIPLGGGYFRALPYWLTSLELKQVHSDNAAPFIFYIHPWELDPGQARLKIPPISFIRHYLNLSITEKKLKKMLSDMKFNSIRDFLREEERNRCTH